MEGLRLLATLDYGVFYVTNQAGLAEGLITQQEFDAINQKVLDLIDASGIVVLETFVCPHGEQDNCDCHKPKPKLLTDAAKKYDIELPESWMIGDRLSDIHTGINAGTKTILVQTGSLLEAPEATYTAPNLFEAAKYMASVV